jgi:hypothetical protein
MATRECDRCGKTYYRSNAVRLWTAINPGHRTGWVKNVERICTACMDDHEAQQVLLQIHPKFIKVGKRRTA